MIKLKKPFQKKLDFPITQGFGENPIVYNRFGLPGHNGLDFGCPADTPIVACADGIVVISEKHKAYGNIVKLKHKGGYFSLCAHMNKRLVTVGERIKQDEVLGLSGSTGFSTGNHLHFGLQSATEGTKPYNYYIDPMPAFKDKLTKAVSEEEKEEKKLIRTSTSSTSKKKSSKKTIISFARKSDKTKTKSKPKKYTFSKNINYRDKSKEVVELQKRLKEEGFFNYPRFTTYYGSVTRQAVLKYQLAKNIVYSPYDVGAGRLGPATRISLNA